MIYVLFLVGLFVAGTILCRIYYKQVTSKDLKLIALLSLFLSIMAFANFDTPLNQTNQNLNQQVENAFKDAKKAVDPKEW
ncbi:hypothetical protein DY052_06110 [Apilactobacillus timberlakei]|uniref:hypothetical protein n=1 Tax=Apilactobacillus timberlakei TaxID=2008380 RepID=UPI00112CF8D4|nr:hypothetical protein [Apilactobacillus timberlakei]TPR14998.1 hypothetical protein DY052_06110 [Apilactobacillus timberlakei]